MIDFDGFDVSLLVDENGEWISPVIEPPPVSAGGATPGQTIQELRVAWGLAQGSYRAHREQIPTPSLRETA